MLKNVTKSLLILLTIWVCSTQAQSINDIDTNYVITGIGTDPFDDDGVDSLKEFYQSVKDTSHYFKVKPMDKGFLISDFTLTQCMENKQLSDLLLTNYGECKDLYYNSISNYQKLKLEDTKLITKMHNGLKKQNEQIENLKMGNRLRNYVIAGLLVSLTYYVAK